MTGRPTWRRLGAAAVGLAGLAGSIACSASMVLAAAGVAATAAGAGGAMARMAPGSAGSGPLTNLLSLLAQAGPAILTGSILAMLLSLALRRRAAVPLALLAGVILFWGMYGQARLPIMFAAIAVGILVLAAAFVWAHGSWVRRPHDQRHPMK